LIADGGRLVPSLIDQGLSAEEAEAVAAWNALADRHPETVKRAYPVFFPKRVAALRHALRTVGGLQGWVAYMAIIEASPLWMGEWQPTFDDALKQRLIIRALEGAYDGPKPGSRFQQTRQAPPRRSAQNENAVRSAIRLGILPDPNERFTIDANPYLEALP
jgi:hypothetical protein